MALPFDFKRVALGLVLGASAGFGYQRLVGCRTGTCLLTATPFRAMAYGALIGLLFALGGCSHGARSGAAPIASGQATPVMPPSTILHLTTGTFDQVRNQEKPVLIDFWAPWCGPCRVEGSILEQVATGIGDQALVAKVNVDEEAGLAATFGIQVIPTLVILKGGRVVQRFTGVQYAKPLVRALQAAGS